MKVLRVLFEEVRYYGQKKDYPEKYKKYAKSTI